MPEALCIFPLNKDILLYDHSKLLKLEINIDAVLLSNLHIVFTLELIISAVSFMAMVPWWLWGLFVFNCAFADPIQDPVLHDLPVSEDNRARAVLTFLLIRCRLRLSGQHATDAMMCPPRSITAGSM